ncbi:MAG: Gfo/Idh/MocA family oxidoreductase [Gemmataceae bacterium]|nr:Gfo/Idh/MocA family oxidoreductase [Gemmataceae bacterium]MDW8265069.1 Gfo/Idh/MocA family oxidoreductase [Gemmataceae bacterium]
MNRRDFLKTSAMGATLAAASREAAALAQEQRLRVGLIGCGWYGKCDLCRLIQVAPVEVVSLCDVDRRMLEEAAELTAARQRSRKKPRLYGDYRAMLKEKDLDLVIIGTPDHWHALPMIAAVEAGADVYVQKPISVDVVEGQAMVAAARKHGRVVQVGTQRRSTPHLMEARDTIIKPGLLGQIGLVEIYCYYHMRSRATPPVSKPPDFFDYEMWTGPAPLRPYDAPPDHTGVPLPHRRWWRAFMEYGNGIMGDMCIHMLDMVRWMLDLGWPKRISSAGGILVEKNARANIPDTQSAIFDFGDLQVVWQHRSWGDPPDPKYPWGATFYGDKGTLKASVHSYDFVPTGKGKPIHRDVMLELDQYPEDQTEKDLEKHAAPANRQHMRNFLQAIASRGRPVADIEQGHISSACCILANISLKLGRSLTWDATRQQVIGDEEANKLLRRPYRSPWVHPEPTA